ncbi:hypothetical protein NGRA_0615 [Nosema granulosis]|uniref:Uncharacterized protein n=1 Tax=Nosema granulosis TaxID=83296 RepID=A0A9P6KZW2_9MICR|nr:hypothetical protein NGRA_0615 [Nosema granulosis]
MEPDENIKKLLRINFGSSDTYFDTKIKLVALERIICKSTDLNIVKGAFAKMLNLFVSRSKAYKRACIPHFRNIKAHITSIETDVTQLFYINDSDVIRLLLQFIRIFARFYCTNNIIVYHVLLTKTKYKYKVLNSLIKRNNSLLGIFEYGKILEKEYQIDRKEIICYEEKVIKKKSKRRKLNKEQNKDNPPKCSQWPLKYLLNYLKTAKNLKNTYLKKNENDLIEFLKVGELDQLKNNEYLANIFHSRTCSLALNEKINKNNGITPNLDHAKNNESLQNVLEKLKNTAKHYLDKAIYGYFTEVDNEDDKKYAFDVLDGVICSSLIVKLYFLYDDPKFEEIERKIVKFSRK